MLKKKGDTHKVTMQMIADMAGVSKTTVSRVINDKSYVAGETRRKITDLIKEYNYVPNVFARALNFNSSHTLGLVITEITNIIIAERTAVIEKTASEQDYSVILCPTGGKIAEEIHYVNILRERKVDGMIIIHAGNNKRDGVKHLFQLKKDDIPFVLICDPVSKLVTDYVVIEHQRGAYDAVKHLLDLGHKQIGYISGPPGLYTEANRFKGYKQALRDYDIEVDDRLIQEGGYDIEDGYRAAISLLKGNVRPSAIFAFNDMEAIGVLRAAKELGLHIPNNLALVGTDDIRIAPLLDVSLTTINFPEKQIGQVAVELLLEQIEAKKASKARDFRKVQVGYHLVIRDSCGAKGETSRE